ncbi:hypothetical protein AAFF_G00135540 [Aldrovandia affinis]|uniref:Uncharacterized protein n=1 Tax=Aldrovandia affinis TaxID=143900 RepID=A0AAD7RQH2_9TELE|nr:hypothetical protein AAFF_G00135540 [Aldrovandia affinis]
MDASFCREWCQAKEGGPETREVLALEELCRHVRLTAPCSLVLLSRAQLTPTVATLRAVDRDGRRPPLSPAQVQEEQERDMVLAHVRSWLAAGKWPEWADVATLDTETKAYHSQWGGLEAREWRPVSAVAGADLMQSLS